MREPLEHLDHAAFDVVIIGAGINGASAAEELAARGYAVLVVDKGDFATGASSRSSRLLHCGLRYLAPGRSVLDFVRHPSRLKVALRMARLAMQARAEFVSTFPERIEPVRLHLPIYRDGRYRAWQIDLAFSILARLGPAEPSLDYRRMSPAEARATPLVGGLRDIDRHVGVAVFREYQFRWPERIAIDAVSRAEAHGAVARNYTKARLVERDAEAWRIELTDMLSQSPPVTVRGRTTLVTAGAWINEAIGAASRRAGRKVFGTKGCHIVVRLPPECRGLGLATFNSLGEPFYCIPWKDLHYFGPTETPYAGDLDRVHVTDQEQAFLLREANALLPGLRLTDDDVLMTWAGVRPLTHDPAVPFGNRSRVLHDLADDGLPDAFAMTAGPVMTHRSAGAEMAERVAARLGPPVPDRQRAPRARAPADHAESLSDMLFRRTDRAWSGPIPDEELATLAGEAALLLGWDRARTEREARAFREEWQRLYRPRRSG